MTTTIKLLEEALFALKQSEKLAFTNKVFKDGQGKWNDETMERIIADGIAKNDELMALCKQQAATALLTIFESSLKLE